MRTDVKLGLIGSFVVVLVAGWYFTGRENPKAAIPLGGSDLVTSVEGSDSARRASSSSPTMLTGVDSVEKSQESDVEQKPETTTVASAAPRPSERDSPLEDLFNDRRSDRDGSGSDPFAEPEDESPLIIDAEQTTQHVADTAPVPSPRTDTAAAEPIRTNGDRPSRGETELTRRFETHTVRPGDTFASLARQYFGDVRFAQTIQDANPQVRDPAAMAVGTVVVIPDIAEPSDIPTATTPKPTPAGDSKHSDHAYTVREGDTLYAIALNRLGSGSRWAELYQLNKAAIGGDPGALKVGLKLVLPTR